MKEIRVFLFHYAVKHGTVLHLLEESIVHMRLLLHVILILFPLLDRIFIVLVHPLSLRINSLIEKNSLAKILDNFVTAFKLISIGKFHGFIDAFCASLFRSIHLLRFGIFFIDILDMVRILRLGAC